MDNSIFNHFTINGNRIELPEMSVVKISKQNYAQIKKIMLNNLGRYKNNGFNFPYNPAELLEKLKAGDNETMVKKFQFFPTPPEVMDKMLQIVLPLEPLAEGHTYEFSTLSTHQMVELADHLMKKYA